jgi:hypothetical protein
MGMVTKAQREARVAELIKKAEEILVTATTLAKTSPGSAEMLVKVAEVYRELAENVKWEV